LEIFTIKYGTMKKLLKNIERASFGDIIDIAADIAKDNVIPNQKSKFILLSWVKKDFFRVIRLLLVFFNMISSVAKLLALSKVKIIVTGSFLIYLVSNCCFATELLHIIHKTEEQHGIPKGLLVAMAKVESGFNPHALNINGKAVLACNQQESLEIIKQELQIQNYNIDVGLLQINLKYHGREFDSINSMLDVRENLAYAAIFLSKLYKKHNSWAQAVRYYHSGNSAFNRKYSKKVLQAWLNN